MSETRKYLGQGQIGDFMHSICVCKYYYDKYGYKADLYMSENPNPFYKGLQQTYGELRPIMLRQEWINTFKIYEGEPIDMDLSSFRKSPKLFTTNWLEIMFDLFLGDQPIPKEHKWIEMPVDKDMRNCLLINRSTKLGYMSQGVVDKYAEIMKQFDKKYFICTDEEQYEKFPLKEECPMLKANDLYDFFLSINSCHLYVGNQSGPSAWATAMNVPRIIELRNGQDAIHYMKDTEYYSKYEYFIGD